MVMRSAAVDTADAAASRSWSVLSLLKESRRPSSPLVICSILIIYSVVSTVSFLKSSSSSSSMAASTIGADLILLRDFQGEAKQAQAPGAEVVPLDVHAADRIDQQRKINAALQRMNNNTSTITVSPFSLRDPTKSPPFAIFYNVYIPTDQGQTGVAKSLDIIREQVNQVGSSYAASFPGKPVTIFYNTIGKRDVGIKQSNMAHICADHNNVICIHLQHYDTGFELLTLQRMYDYCQYTDNVDHDVDDRVVYMHNKGSYHSVHGEADRVRRHLTMAITNQQCLAPVDDTCSACGLRFFTVWSMQFPGNFFTTKCSYVRKLIPPTDFTAKLTTVFDRLADKIEENPLYLEISPNFTAWAQEFGKGRYIATHWVGSHPSLVPCDLTEDVFDDWTWNDRKESDFSWGMIPRPTQKSHQHNKLLGNLFKWFNLYNEAPGDDSWAWRSFPDGAQWKAAVAQFGNRTVEVTLETERNKTIALALSTQNKAVASRRNRR